MKKKYINHTIERRIECYPHPKYYKMFIAYAAEMVQKRAELSKNILESFFNSMPENQQKQLIEKFDKLSDRERRSPGRISNNSY